MSTEISGLWLYFVIRIKNLEKISLFVNKDGNLNYNSVIRFRRRELLSAKIVSKGITNTIAFI